LNLVLALRRWAGPEQAAVQVHQPFSDQPDGAKDQADERLHDLDHPEIVEDEKDQGDHDQQGNQRL
jgi:hypothetical protein